MNRQRAGRGQIIPRQRQDGTRTWLVRVYVGQDESGRRSYRSETVAGSRKSAEKRLTEVLAEKDTVGRLTRLTRQTVGGYLTEWTDQWLQGVTDRTRHSYRWLLDRYVIPEIGIRKVATLTDTELQRLLRQLLQAGKSARTVRYTATVLKAALRHGVRRGVLPRNPMDTVQLPKLSKRLHPSLTPELAQRFLAAAKEDRWAAFWSLCVATGIRPGEALALRWSDLRGDTLHIQRSRGYVSKKGWSEHEPKTDRSRRGVALPAFAVTALREHKRRQAAEKLRAGAEYCDEGYIFAGYFGEPIGIRSLNDSHFQKILQRGKLPPMRLYDLRHLAATLRLANGEHPKIVSEMLGHSSVTQTLDTYSHVTPTMQRESAARLDTLMRSRVSGD